MATAIGQTVRSYAELTKPRLLPLVLVTGLPALVMSAGEWPAPHTMGLILLGIALTAAAASTFNAYIERDVDKQMERTKDRPLPAGRLAPGAALAFAFVLTGLSTAILYRFGGALAAGLGVATILFYVFVYTIWLKPRSAWNAVIGGAAGAAAPLIADAAVNGSIGAPGLMLFAIVFFWQPPHVWAIALFRKDEYARAGLPVLPNVIGEHPTRWRMLWFTVGLVPVTLAPVALGLSGTLYLVVALTANGWFLSHAVRVLRQRTPEAARAMFFASLGYLFALFAAMIAELALGLSPALA